MSKRACKILFVTPSLTGGGAERVITTLLRHFDRSKFELALAVVSTGDAAFLDQVPADVRLIGLGSTRVRYAVPRIMRLIWSTQPDVVVSTLGYLNLALAILRPLLPSRVRIVGRETVVVSEGLWEYGNPWAWRIIYRLFSKRLDRLICQSTDMRNDLVQNFSVPQDLITVIHNPVDIVSIRAQATVPIEEENPRRREYPAIRLVAAGRLVPQKGFDLLIKAVALCSDVRLRVKILGEGPLQHKLKSLTEKLGVSAQFSFAGFQQNPFAHFAAADAFILCSRYEGFPNVALEALTCGTPIIAMPCPGGTRELLDGVPSCELAADVSAQALADAIRRWAAGPRSRVDPSVVEVFSAPAIARAYEREILRVAPAL